MSKKRFFVRPSAREDIRHLIHYYHSLGGRALAERFLSVVRRALRLLRDQPSIGSPRSVAGYRSIRSWRLNPFPQLTYYFDQAGNVNVLRVLHERRALHASSSPEERSCRHSAHSI